MARLVGQKKAREIWFLCRYYSAQEAVEMGVRWVDGWVGGWVEDSKGEGYSFVLC